MNNCVIPFSNLLLAIDSKFLSVIVLLIFLNNGHGHGSSMGVCINMCECSSTSALSVKSAKKENKFLKLGNWTSFRYINNALKFKKTKELQDRSRSLKKD